MTVYVRRASGLLAEFQPPEVTAEAAIDRGWHLDGRLMLPNQPEYLPAYPDRPWEYAPARIPWDNSSTDAFLRGLAFL